MSLTLKISIPVHKEGRATVNRGQAATAIAGRRSVWADVLFVWVPPMEAAALVVH
jgi:hypothetical protein